MPSISPGSNLSLVSALYRFDVLAHVDLLIDELALASLLQGDF